MEYIDRLQNTINNHFENADVNLLNAALDFAHIEASFLLMGSSYDFRGNITRFHDHYQDLAYTAISVVKITDEENN